MTKELQLLEMFGNCATLQYDPHHWAASEVVVWFGPVGIPMCPNCCAKTLLGVVEPSRPKTSGLPMPTAVTLLPEQA